MAGPTAHSKLGASGMSRWANCPGSVKLSEGMPNPSSIYAEEGTKAHDLAAEVLEGRLSLEELDCDAEMKGAIRVYVEYCLETKEKRNCEMLIEHRFDLSSIHPGCFGTGDCVLYDSKNRELFVYDLKYGAGLPVEAEGNMQLQYYGLGALLSTGYPCERVTVGIIQPRCEHWDGPIRTWTLDVMELLDFTGVLKRAAEATEQPNAPVNTGDWCRFCNGKAVCPEFKDKANALAATVFSYNEPYKKTELAHALEMLPAVKTWVKAVEEFAFHEATNGRVAPGFKLVEKRAQRKWIDEVEASTIIKDTFKISREDAVIEKLRSPAQVEKLLASASRKDTLFTDLYTKESSGLSLVSESDKRPAAKVSPGEVFGIINDQDEEG